MNWRVVLGNHAEKQLRRVPVKDAQRITEALVQLSTAPFKSDIVKLEGRGEVWRFRVGNYRILFEFYTKERMIFIYEIIRRTTSTY